MGAGTDDLEGEIAVGDLAVESDLAEVRAGDRRLGGVVDGVELQVGDKRKLEMQLGFDAAADMRRIDADRPRVAQRLRIDDFERVLKRTGQRQVDAQPFGALAELAQLYRPAGDLH